MSLGSLSILKGLVGRQETKVLEGENPDQVLIQQAEKVLVLQTEDFSISHTWYPLEGSTIRAAVRNTAATQFEKTDALLALKHEVALVSTAESRIQKARQRIGVGGLEIFDLKWHKDHLVIFPDGGVERLGVFTKEEEQEAGQAKQASPAVLLPDDRLLETWVCDSKGLTYVVHVVEAANALLTLVWARLAYNPETSGLSAEHVQRCALMPRNTVNCWDVYGGDQGVLLLLWKQSGEILQSYALRRNLEWTTVLSIPNAKDTAIAILNENFFAVMYTAGSRDGGMLQLISLPYRLVTSTAPLKTTVHSGRGLWHVKDRLFMVGGGRVASCRVSGLESGLDSFIGKAADRERLLDSRKERSAVHLYASLPKLFIDGATDLLVRELQDSVDLPEQLLMDAIIYFLKLDINEAALVNLLKPVLLREFSDILLFEEISRLDINQVLKLVEIISSQLEECTEDRISEARLLEWISLLYNSHYVQLLLSKDERSVSVLDQLSRCIEDLQQAKAAFTTARSILHTLQANSNTANNSMEPNMSLGYCIELIQI